MRPSIIAAIALLLSLGPASALPLIRLADADMPAKKGTVASPDTARYVREAALDDQYDLAAAKLAQQRATSPQVKDFAKLIIKDTTTANNDLRATVWQANIQVAVPDKLDDKHAGMLHALDTASLDDFDRRYMQQQILEQDDAARVHIFYGDNGDNRLLREFANDTGSTVESHLALARHLTVGLGPMQARQ